MKYKKDWLQQRINDAAKEFDTYPETVKEALKLTVSDDRTLMTEEN